MGSQSDRSPHVLFITLSVMLATIMQALDSTIANVSLPHMRGTMSATSDQIAWVLTSYIVAAAIATPLTGFLAARLGRKKLMLLCVTGFTIASVLCGMAQTLNQIVFFRLMQGLFGAGLVPLSQATLLDTYPVAEHASAMAFWGVGVMVGPIFGPMIGGYLTEYYNWRWVFYINLPVGILAFLGIFFYVQDTALDLKRRFDWVGFFWFSVGLGALQMVLDRGETLNWFSSSQIRILSVLSVFCLYEFLVHTWLHAREHPFIETRLFQDRNFTLGMFFVFLIGALLLSVMALLPLFLKDLRGYPVVHVGLLLAPRGLGMMLAMLTTSKLAHWVDPRFLMTFGMLVLIGSLQEMAHFNLDVQEFDVVRSGLIQGIGLGFVFAPINAVSFSTLSPKYRNDGTALFSLQRSLGSSFAIAILVSMVAENTQGGHEALANLFNPFYLPWRSLSEILETSSIANLAILDTEIRRQAASNAYSHAFEVLKWMAIFILPLVWLFQPRKTTGGSAGTADQSAPPSVAD